MFNNTKEQTDNINHFSMESNSESFGDLSDDYVYDLNDNEVFDYAFISMVSLQTLFAQIHCQQCSSTFNSVKIKMDGLLCKLNFYYIKWIFIFFRCGTLYM